MYTNKSRLHIVGLACQATAVLVGCKGEWSSNDSGSQQERGQPFC